MYSQDRYTGKSFKTAIYYKIVLLRAIVEKVFLIINLLIPLKPQMHSAINMRVCRSKFTPIELKYSVTQYAALRIRFLVTRNEENSLVTFRRKRKLCNFQKEEKKLGNFLEKEKTL
jgi:hypothetical protein